jgi:D-serine deaminase-like pyridoxal phosphate-dependent protein
MPPTARVLDDLDTPQLLLDLDTVDANLARMQETCRRRGVMLRPHFKSLKCGGLARYLLARGVGGFLCAKLNEAEVLADAGVADVFVANQIVGPLKAARLAALARRAKVRVCVDDADNVAELGAAARQAGVTIEALVEIDTGMGRCGVEPGADALSLARRVAAEPGLRFVGLQAYDGHLQLLPDEQERKTRCREGVEKALATRRLLERNDLHVSVLTGAGTGTLEHVGGSGFTEVQPGSFLLMDAAYHAVRPEYGVSLTVLATVLSRRPAWYVLDAGSKAVSKDFAMPQIKGRPGERVVKLAEEHTKVEDGGAGPRLGERREVVSAHCCATVNLHRRLVAHRGGRVEAEWPVEASGRYD